MHARRVSVVALNGLAFELATPRVRMMAAVLGGVAQFERERTQERVRSGLAAAKARGPRCWDASPGSGRRTAWPARSWP